MPYAETPQPTQTATMPSQPTGQFNVPQLIQQARQQGVPDQQIYQYLQQNNAIPQQTQPQDTAQLHDTGSFMGNLGNSIGNFASSIGNAVLHPINTVENIGKGLIGAGENLGAAITGGPKANDQFTQVANNIGSYITQRYGSLDAAKKTAYQDPVGFLADASTVLSGAGAAVSKVGEFSDASRAASLASGAAGDLVSTAKGLLPTNSIEAANALKTPGVISQAGNAISKAGEVTNPINIAGKVVNNPITRGVTDFAGRRVSNILGAATGSGSSSIKEVFNAAKENNPEAIQAVRGSIPESQIIDTAQTALDNLKQAKNTNYQQQLSKVKGVEGEVDYMPAVQEFRTQLANNGITVKAGELQFENARGFQNPSEQAVLQNVYDKMERWGDIPANSTLYGLDTLKQQLGDFYEQANGKAKPVIASTKSVLSDVLKQNPDYKNLVEPYETTSRLIDEMKTVVAKNPETALKKLTKAVSQDNQYRQSLIEELDKYTPNEENLKTQLAGLNMKNWDNHSKLFTYGEIGTALFQPHLLPAFIASSPRVTAEFLNALGYSSAKITQGLQLLKDYKAATIANTAARINKSTSSNPDGLPKSKKPKSILIKMSKS